MEGCSFSFLTETRWGEWLFSRSGWFSRGHEPSTHQAGGWMDHIRSGHDLWWGEKSLLQSLHWLSYATNNAAAARDDNMYRTSRLGSWHHCFICGIFQVRSATRTPAVSDRICGLVTLPSVSGSFTAIHNEQYTRCNQKVPRLIFLLGCGTLRDTPVCRVVS